VGGRHLQLEQETVELRLGQGVGAFELDGVLRGDDAEGPRQGMRLPARRHLPLLHGLEQSRLRARCGAVDLVHQQQLREHRAGAERKAPARLQHLGTADVGRQQVGRALHARAAQSEQGGHRARQRRLAQTRQALDQHMATGKQSRQQVADERLLTNQHALELPLQRQQPVLRGLEGFGRRKGIQGRLACFHALR
jgi:hypothetical protein